MRLSAFGQSCWRRIKVALKIFEELQTMTYNEFDLLENRSQITCKKQCLRLSLWATNTYEKCFYTFRIHKIILTYGKRKKKRPNSYGMFNQNLPISAAFPAILKITRPQCNAIGVRKPSVFKQIIRKFTFHGYFWFARNVSLITKWISTNVSKRVILFQGLKSNFYNK